MPDPNVQSDMQGAGVQAPPTPTNQGDLSGFDPASLLQALSRGPVAQAQQNPLMSLAAGLAGVNSGYHNTVNPVVAQVGQQEETHRRSILAMQSVMNEVEQMRKDKEKTFLGIANDLANSDSPEARTLGWQAKGSVLKKNGIELPPNVIQGLSAGKLSFDKLQSGVYVAMGGGTDEEIGKMVGNDPLSIATAKKMALTPAAYKHFMGHTPEEVQQKADEYQLKLVTQRQNDTKIEMQQRRDEEKARASEARDTRMEASGILAQQRLEQGNKRIELMMQEAAARDRRFYDNMAAKNNAKVDKRAETIQALRTSIEISRELAVNLDKKGYLQKTSAGVIGGILSGDLEAAKSAAQAKTNQTLYSGDGDWTAWKQHSSLPVGFDRTVMNELGAKAVRVFQNQMDLYDHPPTLQAINQVLDNMERVINESEKKTAGGRKPERVVIQIPGMKQVMEKVLQPGEQLPPGARIIEVDGEKVQ